MYRNRWLPWIMLVVGLLVGYFVGRTTMAQARVGDCVDPRDTSTVATNVTEASCAATCRTCMWVQD